MLPQAEKIRDHLWLIIANWMSECTASAKGEWEEARSFSDKALAVGAIAPALATRVHLEYESGRFTEGKKYLEQLRAQAEASPPWPIFEYAAVANCLALVARIAGEPDRFEEAEAAAKTITSSSSATPVYRLTSQVGLALVAVAHTDPTASQELYDQLMPMNGKYLLGTAVDRILGLLASTIEHSENAARHLNDALTFCRKGGYRPELAWTCHDYAELVLRHTNPGKRKEGARPSPTFQCDGAMAAALLEEGMAIAAELGMPPLMSRIAALQESAAAEPQPSPAYPNGLTQREVEVLLQLAQGKTNREIAGELVLSERTVQRHISNLYAKIYVRNRSEATAFALSQLPPSIEIFLAV